MYLGGNLDVMFSSPEEWYFHLKALGYSAAICPVKPDDPTEKKASFQKFIREKNIVLGEIGVWNNPLAPDPDERRQALRKCKETLALGDEMGVRCCVNISGARGEVWDACYAENYASDTYALIVDSTREILDDVKPLRCSYCLEPMPWMHPDSPDDYLQLVRDIDRPMFSVHLDYANMVNSVEKYLRCNVFIEECFRKLGPLVKSIHAKDIIIANRLPCAISEVPPGRGIVDFARVLHLADGLSSSTTVFIEHLSSYDQYQASAAYIRSVAGRENIKIPLLP